MGDQISLLPEQVFADAGTMDGPGAALTAPVLAEPSWRSDMADRTCSIEDCDRPVIARGFCNSHYKRWRAEHSLSEGPARTRGVAVTPASFWNRTVVDGACVLWTGRLDRDGYGHIGWDGRSVLAHRLAFYLRLGRWPDGILRHLCNRPACVLHAVEGTQAENMRDVVAAGNHPESTKTHCPAGHPYDEANTRRHGNRRHCRACQRRWNDEAARRRSGGEG